MTSRNGRTCILITPTVVNRSMRRRSEYSDPLLTFPKLGPVSSMAVPDSSGCLFWTPWLPFRAFSFHTNKPHLGFALQSGNQTLLPARANCWCPRSFPDKQMNAMFSPPPLFSLRRWFLEIIHLVIYGCEHNLEAAVMPDGQLKLGALPEWISEPHFSLPGGAEERVCMDGEG